MQGEREAWLQENKEAINAKIERGLAQLDRGEGIPSDRGRERIEADKAGGSQIVPDREARPRRAGI
jgi:hypothetical protein